MGKQRIRRFFRRKYLKFLIKQRQRSNKRKKIFFNDDKQEDAYFFVENNIKHPRSRLLLLPDSGNYYVSRDKIRIVFNRKVIMITTENFKFDMVLNDRMFENLYISFTNRIRKDKAALDREIDQMEKEIMSGIFEAAKSKAPEGPGSEREDNEIYRR